MQRGLPAQWRQRLSLPVTSSRASQSPPAAKCRIHRSRRRDDIRHRHPIIPWFPSRLRSARIHPGVGPVRVCGAGPRWKQHHPSASRGTGMWCQTDGALRNSPPYTRADHPVCVMWRCKNEGRSGSGLDLLCFVDILDGNGRKKRCDTQAHLAIMIIYISPGFFLFPFVSFLTTSHSAQAPHPATLTATPSPSSRCPHPQGPSQTTAYPSSSPTPSPPQTLPPAPGQRT